MNRLIALSAFALLTACAAAGGEDEPGIGAEGGMCGGIAGFQCADDGNYCEVEPGVCGRVADYAGICAPRPQFCTREYRPVCGCDGETYSNACDAASQGVSTASEGICENR